MPPHLNPDEKIARIDEALPKIHRLLEACSLCGRRCGMDRRTPHQSYCIPKDPLPLDELRIASDTLHYGEEPMLVGKGGSGTVFFTHCNLRCVFCQNYQISQENMGDRYTYEELAEIFLILQDQGAENINLVTPTHSIYPILMALREAYEDGLHLPLVYNTNGYDSLELLTLLDGIVDIYLPDLKYMEGDCADRYSGARNYPETAQAAIKEMYQQVGPVQLHKGVARQGLIIRHLILPNNLSNTYDFLLWLKHEGLIEATIGLMSQYAPRHHADTFPELNQTLPKAEYTQIVQYAVELGFENILAQELDSAEVYFPDFENDTPFSEK